MLLIHSRLNSVYFRQMNMEELLEISESIKEN
jgi:hypothetical protein